MKYDLYSSEVSGSGTTAIADTTFTEVDCTGVVPENAYLSIELKCTDWSKATDSQIEITSSGQADLYEWHVYPVKLGLQISTTYQTFEIPLDEVEGQGGGLDVSEIDYIRWYGIFSTSQTIYWKNAKIIKYPAIVKKELEYELYSSEVSGTGTTAYANKSFTSVNCTGVWRSNAYLSIDLKCTDWSKVTDYSQIEITSSGGSDAREWHCKPIDLNLDITTDYKTFEIPLSDFSIQPGFGPDVSAINFIRFYASFSSSQTVYWKNAKIVRYPWHNVKHIYVKDTTWKEPTNIYIKDTTWKEV